MTATVEYSDIAALTDRQRKALDEAITEARDVYGVEIRGVSDLSFRFEEETRPGRGCDMHFTYADGDHVISGGLDVYGHGYLCVGEVDWTHNSSADECDCGKGDCRPSSNGVTP